MMRNNVKKHLLLFLSAAMIIFSFIGCTTNGNSKKTNKDLVEKPITLTYWAPLDAASASTLSNYSDMEIYKKMKELTNIEIKFKHPPVGQNSEQFNLMIASKDLPDLVEYQWATAYPGGAEKAIADNMIIKLNDYVEKHAPNLKSILESDVDVNKQARTDNKTLYMFPAIGTGSVKTTSGLMIRKDWLDDLGVKAPETLDEWTNVLKLFKEKKGAVTPFTAIPENFDINEMFNGAFGVGNRYYLENGKVKFGPLEPQYKEYVKFLREWYGLGLLDQNFLANNLKSVDAKIRSGETGAFYGAIGRDLGNTMSFMKDKDPKFDLVAVQYPVKKKGDVPQFVQRAWEVRKDGMLAITTANKHPVESVKWADYFYSKEGNLLKNFGIEGLTYEMKDGYPTYMDLIKKNPQGLSLGQAISRYTRASVPSPGLIDSRYHEQFYTLPQQQDALTLWGKVSDNALNVMMPQVTPTESEMEELAVIKSSIDSYCKEMFVKFVMGVEPLERYDAMVDQIKKMKIERAIEIYQAALNRYNNR